MPVVHDGGALLAFVCGVAYTLLQSIISYKSCPQWNSLTTCHVRMAISAVSCAAVVPSILSEKHGEEADCSTAGRRSGPGDCEVGSCIRERETH